MIGNVGGTLGLFVGFSFTGLISFFLNITSITISTIRQWTMNKKVEDDVVRFVMSKDQIQGLCIMFKTIYVFRYLQKEYF